MKKYSILIFLMVSLGACSTVNEFQVTRVGEEPEKYLERSIYVLPRTSFLLTLEFEKEVLIPGPYYLYTERFLGIDGAIEKQDFNYRISSVVAEAVTEPDPDHFYSINTLKGDVKSADLLNLTEMGYVLRPDQVYSVKSDLPGGMDNIGYPYFTDLSVKRHLQEVTDTLYKTVITDSSYVRIPVLRKQREAKTLEQKAEEAANFIIKTRKRRFKLLAGQYEIFPEGDALAISVEELNRTEKEYLELFLGKRIKTQYRQSFIITPEPGSNPQVLPVARFSESMGVEDVKSSSGQLIEMNIHPLGIVDKLRNLNAKYPDSEKINNLYYRIPDLAELFILVDGEEILRQRVSIYQAGVLVNMPVQP